MSCGCRSNISSVSSVAKGDLLCDAYKPTHICECKKKQCKPCAKGVKECGCRNKAETTSVAVDCYDLRNTYRNYMVCAWVSFRDNGDLEDRRIFKMIQHRLANTAYCPTVDDINEVKERYE